MVPWLPHDFAHHAIAISDVNEYEKICSWGASEAGAGEEPFGHQATPKQRATLSARVVCPAE